MLPEKIMQTDLLDIIFEHRNKTYGAYNLRKSYNKILICATAITFFIATIFSFLPFIHPKNKTMLTPEFIFLPDQELIKVNLLQQAEPIVNKPAEKKFNQQIFTPPVITNENITTETPTIDDLAKSITGPENITGNHDEGIIQPPAETTSGTGSNTSQKVATVNNDKPLYAAAVMPEYPGGIKALKEFMLKNLRQPDDIQAGQKFVVKAFFVVNKIGLIEQVKIVSGGRNDLDKEVERVINKMPAWKPGLQNGAPVAVYFTLPVTFMAEEE